MGLRGATYWLVDRARAVPSVWGRVDAKTENQGWIQQNGEAKKKAKDLLKRTEQTDDSFCCAGWICCAGTDASTRQREGHILYMGEKRGFIDGLLSTKPKNQLVGDWYFVWVCICISSD